MKIWKLCSMAFLALGILAAPAGPVQAAGGDLGLTVSLPGDGSFPELEGETFSGELYFNGEADPGGSLSGMEKAADITFQGGDHIPVDAPGWYGLQVGDYGTDDYCYKFGPSIVHVSAGDGQAELVLKPERDLRTGSITVVKSLSGYDGSRGDAKFMFLVKAEKKLPGGDAVHEERLVDLFFTSDGEQEVLVDGLPYGADVTVEETYSGAGYGVSGENMLTTSVSGGGSAVRFENKGVPGETYGETVVNRFRKTPDGWSWEPDPEPEEPVRETPKTGLRSRAASFFLVALCLIAAAAILYGIRKGGRWGKVFFGIVGVCCLLGLTVALRTFALPTPPVDGGLEAEMGTGRAIRESWSEGAKHVGAVNTLDVPCQVRVQAEACDDAVLEVLAGPGWEERPDGWVYWEGQLLPGDQTEALDIRVSPADSDVEDFEVPVHAELLPEGADW